MFQAFNFFNWSSWHFSKLLLTSCNSSSCSFQSKTCICSTRHVRHTFLIFELFHIFLASAQRVWSNQDVGVEQMNFEQMTHLLCVRWLFLIMLKMLLKIIFVLLDLPWFLFCSFFGIIVYPWYVLHQHGNYNTEVIRLSICFLADVSALPKTINIIWNL